MSVLKAYYNEFDPYAAAWLRNLISAGHIAPGDVDERSIVDVRPDDLKGYTQVHFFAGIGGWSLAARLAGWEDGQALWTGSCPCQPLSSAARGRNVAVDMWPVWRELIAASRPREVFGEQVAQAAGWQDQVGNDLEAMGYAFGSAVLPAISVGQDHIRHRFYFVGYSNRQSESGESFDGEVAGLRRDRSDTGSVVSTNGVSHSVAALRAFGNAIVPEVAAEFILCARNALSKM